MSYLANSMFFSFPSVFFQIKCQDISVQLYTNIGNNVNKPLTVNILTITFPLTNEILKLAFSSISKEHYKIFLGIFILRYIILMCLF